MKETITMWLADAGKWWNGIAGNVIWKKGRVDITTGEVVWSALLVLAGLWLVRWLANWIVRRLPEAVRDDPGVHKRVLRALYLVFFVLAGLSALQIMGFPFKTFAALGLGKIGGQNITVGGVLWALGLLLAGRWLSRWLAYGLVRRLPESVRDEPEMQKRVPRALYVAFFLLFVLAALQIMGIPLRTFTFLGSAIALGFGFGAQNLCSNIISGVILKLTRPLGKGDIVESDGRAGTVQVVGFRSTEILTFDGVHLEIPNSNLLSSTIVTRTTLTKMLRGSLEVGVSYDSDTRLVEKLLTELVENHPSVVHEEGYANRVLFKNFGDSALEFTILYWVDISNTTLDIVGGELRHAILESFRANGISIPYPQLDVNFPSGRA
jgi:small-conductance mechanosensitive channel